MICSLFKFCAQSVTSRRHEGIGGLSPPTKARSP